MITIRKQEVEDLTLQQAYSIQEQLNSEMAIADSKLRMVINRNYEQFRKDHPEAVDTEYEEQARSYWYTSHPFKEANERCLWEDKRSLEELALTLSNHIENLSLA